MAYVLAICILVLGFGQSFQNVAGSDVDQLKRSAFPKDKVIFFKAFLPQDTVYGVRSTIVYSDVQHNIGGGYNPSSGVFTAPVTGLYEFKYRMAKKTGTSAELTIFNQHKARASSEIFRDWSVFGVSTIMKVNKGDHVFVRITWSYGNKRTTLRSGHYNQFMGYLIRTM